MGRVALFRPVRWDYFYDPVGKAAVSLHRRLIALRRRREHLRKGEHYFFNDYERYQSRRLLVYSRSSAGGYSLIGLNFGSQDQTVPLRFERSGHYREELHGGELGHLSANEEKWVTLPSNYGRIWTVA
jgi:maltooligosyltrehalose trehalohydrolase